MIEAFVILNTFFTLLCFVALFGIRERLIEMAKPQVIVNPVKDVPPFVIEDPDEPQQPGRMMNEPDTVVGTYSGPKSWT